MSSENDELIVVGLDAKANDKCLSLFIGEAGKQTVIPYLVCSRDSKWLVGNKFNCCKPNIVCS